MRVKPVFVDVRLCGPSESGINAIDFQTAPRFSAISIITCFSHKYIV